MESQDEIILEYKIDNKEEKLRIFGDKFVENNKENCVLKIKNMIYLHILTLINLVVKMNL